MIKKWFMLILTFCCIGGKVTAQNDTVLKLWYDSPARQWVEALPLGNGSLGAMVFGDPIHERLGRFTSQQHQSQGKRSVVPHTPTDIRREK